MTGQYVNTVTHGACHWLLSRQCTAIHSSGNLCLAVHIAIPNKYCYIKNYQIHTPLYLRQSGVLLHVCCVTYYLFLVYRIKANTVDDAVSTCSVGSNKHVINLLKSRLQTQHMWEMVQVWTGPFLIVRGAWEWGHESTSFCWDMFTHSLPST